MDLFIASMSDRPDLLMVSSSADAYKSCELMQRGHRLTVEPVAIFCGAGDCDHVVHQALERWKVFGGWYEVTLEAACDVICRALEESSHREMRSSAVLL